MRKMRPNHVTPVPWSTDEKWSGSVYRFLSFVREEHQTYREASLIDWPAPVQISRLGVEKRCGLKKRGSGVALLSFCTIKLSVRQAAADRGGERQWSREPVSSHYQCAGCGVSR